MTITIKECPHCYTRVGFKEDGVCPACAKNFSDPSADHSKTLFTISEVSVLPSICVLCGSKTDRKVTISESNRSRTSGILGLVWTFLVYCLALVSRGFIHLLDRNESKQKHPYQRVRVSIPLCLACQRRYGCPRPQRVNFEHGTISILVSQTIATDLAQTTDQASPRL